jgi:hypothetical protein
MFLLYVDESGDVGTKPGASPFFILSGLVVHELRWRSTLGLLVNMRRRIRAKYGIKLREEIHAAEMIHSAGDLRRISRWERLRILGGIAQYMAQMPDISLIHILVDKKGTYAQSDIFDVAWRALLQRFHNTISHRNFPGPANPDERGLLICDDTNGQKLTRLVRKLRVFNPVPNQTQYGEGTRQIPLDTLVEDPIERNSQHSYFLQCCDVAAYLLTQKNAPNKFFRKRGARNYFDRLDPILCKVASSSDPQGVVKL